jgi:hypothetical protein
MDDCSHGGHANHVSDLETFLLPPESELNDGSIRRHICRFGGCCGWQSNGLDAAKKDVFAADASQQQNYRLKNH